ncbi:MAG: hypothetical protein DRJ62_00730 [Thermoprotei archaeon]|nr:MAG: hypothetical protein DRJ62_00730 [Thermoprotei archaeon]
MLKEALERMGLSEAESSIYLFLNENPRKRLEEIADSLKLKESEVEGALSSLYSKGLVVRVEEGLYDVVQPSRALENLLQLKLKLMEAEVVELRRQASMLREALESKYWESRYGIREELILDPLESLTAMEVKTVKMIMDANSEIMIFTASFEWLPKVKEVLLDSARRGVKVRVLMRVSDEASKARAMELLKGGVHVKNVVEKWYPVRGTIVDRSKLLFLIWATERKTSYYKPHYTENPGLIKVFLDAFEKRWERAVEVA